MDVTAISNTFYKFSLTGGGLVLDITPITQHGPKEGEQ